MNKTNIFPDLPPLSALRTFAAAARLQSFSRAADELCVSHSAVSHQISHLESWLGVKLFDRHARGVSPTEVGRQLDSVVNTALHNIGDLCARIKNPNPALSLSVAALPSFATRWLIPLLPGFYKAHPDIDLRILYSPKSDDIRFDNADIILTHIDGAPVGDFESQRLLDGAVEPVCSPGYLQKQGPFKKPRDLLVQPLLHDEDREGWRLWFDKAGIGKQYTDKSGTVFADFNLLSTAAIAGQGIALCPTQLVADDLAQGSLTRLFSIPVRTERAYYLLHKSKPDDVVAIFKRWLIREVKKRLGKSTSNKQ